MPVKEKVRTLIRDFFVACARDVDFAAQEGSSLVIAPHPDDESLGCGATIALLRSLRQRVRIVIVTDGAACGMSAKVPPVEIAAIRRRETLDAAEALGVPVEDVVFLQFPDKGTETRASAVESSLRQEIITMAPCRIFSPYGVDGHPDHRVIAAAVQRLYAKKSISCPVYEYPIWFWNVRAIGHLFQPLKLVRLRRVPTRQFLVAKKVAIAAHCSQNVPLTDEPGWFVFHKNFLPQFINSFELFFEK